GDDGFFDVVGGDADRNQQHRRDIVGAVVHRASREFRRVFTVQQRDRQRGSGSSFSLDRLVDGHRLTAGEDVLDTTDRRVLTGHGDIAQTLIFQRGSHRTGEAVIGGQRGVDVTTGGGQHLLEDDQRFLIVP